MQGNTTYRGNSKTLFYFLFGDLGLHMCQLPLLDSNQQITESKSVALPFGEGALKQVFNQNLQTGTTRKVTIT